MPKYRIEFRDPEVSRFTVEASDFKIRNVPGEHVTFLELISVEGDRGTVVVPFDQLVYIRELET